MSQQEYCSGLYKQVVGGCGMPDTLIAITSRREREGTVKVTLPVEGECGAPSPYFV